MRIDEQKANVTYVTIRNTATTQGWTRRFCTDFIDHVVVREATNNQSPHQITGLGLLSWQHVLSQPWQELQTFCIPQTLQLYYLIVAWNHVFFPSPTNKTEAFTSPIPHANTTQCNDTSNQLHTHTFICCSINVPQPLQSEKKTITSFCSTKRPPCLRVWSPDWGSLLQSEVTFGCKLFPELQVESCRINCVQKS